MGLKRKDVVAAIVQYIIDNEPVTLDQLEQRAVTKSWYTPERFLAVLHDVGSHKKIKATNSRNTIVYKVKQVTKAAEPPRYTYAAESFSESFKDSPFKICFCRVSHVHWRPKFGHFPDCESITHSTEYRKQNPWDRTASMPIDLVAYEREVARMGHAARMGYTGRNGSRGKSTIRN